MAFVSSGFPFRRAAVLAGVLWGLGCGTQGASGGLTVSLFPQSGLSGFELLTSDQAPFLNAPYILLQPGLSTDAPTALVNDQGDGVMLWFTAQRVGQKTADSFIGQALADPLLSGAMGVTQALVPDRPWEQGALFHPTLLTGVPGPFPQLLLYQGMDGSVGAAVFGAGGAGGTLSKLPPSSPSPLDAPPLAARADLAGTGTLGSVSAVVVGNTLRLYYLVNGTEVHRAEADLAAVTRFLSGTGAAISWQPSSPLLTAADFSVPQSSSTSLPAQSLSGLSARLFTTPTGRGRYDLFLVAERTEKGQEMAQSVALAASSYDGVSFLAVAAPIVATGGGVPSSPTVVGFQQQRQLLLLGLFGSELGIAAALIP